MQVAKVAPSCRPEKEKKRRRRNEAESDDRTIKCKRAEVLSCWAMVCQLRKSIKGGLLMYLAMFFYLLFGLALLFQFLLDSVADHPPHILLPFFNMSIVTVFFLARTAESSSCRSGIY